MILVLVRDLFSALATWQTLLLENLALRQQLAVLQRDSKQPRLMKFDRALWVCLSRMWTDWARPLTLVIPQDAASPSPTESTRPFFLLLSGIAQFQFVHIHPFLDFHCSDAIPGAFWSPLDFLQCPPLRFQISLPNCISKLPDVLRAITNKAETSDFRLIDSHRDLA